MVKSDKEKIEIFWEIDKKMIMKGVKVIFIAMLMSIAYIIYAHNTLAVLEFILSIICLIITLYIYKYNSSKQLLQCYITKEYIEFYKNQKSNFKCELNRIISISYNQKDNDIFNKVIINYYDNNKNKQTKVIFLKGMTNIQFCNIVNQMLEEKNDKNLNKCMDDIMIEQVQNDKTIDKEIAKILCYIGKEKIVKIPETANDVVKLKSIFHFIDKNGYLFKISLDEIILEDDLNLKTNNFYTVKINENNKYYLSSTNFKFDYNIVEEYKNKLDAKELLIFDDNIIEEEIEILNKYNKTTKKINPILWSGMILILVIGIIPEESAFYIVKENCITCLFLAVISILFIYYIMLKEVKTKIKKSMMKY